MDSFFPPGLGQAPVLEEGIGDHGHQRMSVEPLPPSMWSRPSSSFIC